MRTVAYMVPISLSVMNLLIDCSRSMLNCVNALEQHLPATEQAGLVSAEEKPPQQPPQDSSGSERSSRAGDTGGRPPPPLPPPRFPNSAV
nr:unnamed protein product [Callosobruchus analis]